MFAKPIIRAAAALLPATVLCVPTTPAAAGDDTTPLTVRLSTVRFTGWSRVVRASAAVPAHLEGHSTACTVTGLYGTMPFVSTCQFDFATSASVSARCSGVFEHTSTLSFPLPLGESAVIVYDPTVTTIVEGDGAGVGVNQLHLGKVYYTIVSLCTLSEQPAEGNLVGSATAL